MPLSIADVKPMNSYIAPLLLVYSTAGLGKTSLALSAPRPIYIPVHPEAPPHNLTPTGFSGITSFQLVMDALRAVYKEENNFATVVIDSLDAMEPLVWSEACKRNNWPNIETPGYGKGYLAADVVWREFITGCDAIRRYRNIAIVWTALAEAATHEEPGTPPFKKYSLRLQKRGELLVTQAPDAVMFINSKATIKEVDMGFNRKEMYVEGGGTRWLYTDGRPHFIAKNRFAMPEQIMLPKEEPWSAIKDYLPPPRDVVPEKLELTPPKEEFLPITLDDAKLPKVNPPSTQAEMAEAIGDNLP